MSAQSMEALALANETRLARAALKRAVTAGEVDVLDVLAEIPEFVGSLPVYQLLKAQDNWGRTKALRALRAVSVPEGKRLDAMTERQRLILREWLAEA